ncbi:MAG: Ig-like domain-containing protein [Prevotella sp.]|nr:Ig-like domain-containing protein [Prevotella sp.]
MKQKFYFKSLLIALFVLFGGGGISAAVETITFSEQGYTNQQTITTVTGTGITITFDKGTNSNAPKYYTSGTAIRAYGGNYFTVEANGKTITQIVLGFGSSDGSNAITTDVGTYSSGTWTGEANSVKFTIGGSSGNRRLASISVTYTTETPSGEENPNNSFAVEEDNATIGEPYTMPEFTTSSDGAKSYSSSNTDVATISSSGQITLKKYGETTITVSTAQTETYAQGSASYLLHVAKGTPVLSFAQETVTAYLGTNQNGPALTNPGDGTPTYTISDPEIATIQSNGYIQPKATGTASVTVTTSETDAWNEATASYTLIVEAPFSVDAIGTYELVTDASMLSADDQILITYIPSDGAGGYVLGAKQTNNYKATLLKSAAVSADKSTIEITSTSQDNPDDPVTAAVLEGSVGAWYFHVNDGYLCATSSSSNNLGAKTLDAAGNNAKATISISGGNATITFQGSFSHNLLKYNSTSKLFSCYSSGQTPVQIYRKVPSNVAPTVTFSPASGTVVDYGTQVTITARTAMSITYSVNDGDPVTVEGTSATVTINSHTTIKATATNEYGTSEEATAEYTINQESSALSYNPTEYTITIGDDFTAPEVNKPEDYNGTITYSSSDTSVAEVDAQTGAVTVNGAGTVTITASGTETEHYAAATASYTLTVNKKSSAVSFAESVVEITYGDNYNKQAATTEGVSGNLVYTSSDESIVKFHGNNVIDVLGPGTVTITATAPATETTEESSATYTLKVYAPADAVEGATEVLNEDFSACNGTNNNWGGSSGYVTITGLDWETTNCQAGPGYVKMGSANNAGSATSPAFSVVGEAPLSFALAPWIATNDTEDATVNVTLTNATFANGESTMTLSTGNLTQREFTTFDQYTIVGNSDEVTITFSGAGSYDRFFLDNVVVGGGAQPAHEINLTFSSAGYLTWVATADIDFSQTEGVTAYQITEATTQKIIAEEVDKVPAGAAVMLKGSGTVQLKRTSDVAALANNKMLACTDASVVGITGNQTTTDIYVLGNGSNGLGYYMLKNTLQAGKGYLNISGGASAKVTFVAFEETVPTGISSVSADSADGVYYNLQGVRVLNPQKGIYIKDGKKIVIK